MSFLSGIFGGDTGANFKAQSANVVNPLDNAQVQSALSQAGANGALGQQQSLANALAAQGGLQNQSNIYNQLGQIASGQGPNPAQAMLNQATGQNIANQAALAAGQRGAGANAGLIARQVGQQGGALQQQAVGQGATLQAQQALNAIGQQSGIANNQVANQLAGQNAYTQAAQNQVNQLIGGQNAGNQAQLQNIQQQNAANAQIANTNAQTQASLLKGAVSGLGAGLGAGPGESGVGEGLAGAFAKGGAIGQHSVGPISKIGQHFVNYAKGGKVKALVSPGERYLPPKEVEAVAKGKKSPMKAGEKIPGKAKVAGAKDSYANDIVEKTLKEGGIVLPRSVTQSKNPAHEAKKFIAEILTKKRK